MLTLTPSLSIRTLSGFTRIPKTSTAANITVNTRIQANSDDEPVDEKAYDHWQDLGNMLETTVITPLATLVWVGSSKLYTWYLGCLAEVRYRLYFTINPKRRSVIPLAAVWG